MGLLVGVVLLAASAVTAQVPRAGEADYALEDLSVRAELFVRALLDRRLLEARAEMTPRLRRMMNDAVIDRMIGGFLSENGPLESMGSAQVEPQRNGTVIGLVPLDLYRSDVDVVIVFERQGPLAKITSFSLRPRSAEPKEMRTGRPAPNEGPPYADKFLFRETPYRLEVGARTLPAVLAMPTIASESIKVPAVVIVPNDFFADTEGTIRLPLLGSSPGLRESVVHFSRDVAQGLATRGIAVFRYAQRTTEYPEEFAGEFGAAELVTEDALAAVAAVRRMPRVDPARVTVLGVGMSAAFAPHIAREAGAAQVLLMEPWPMDVEALLRPADMPTTATFRLEDAARGGMIEGLPVRFWRDVQEARPAEALRGGAGRWAVLFGERPRGTDYKREWEALAGANSLNDAVRTYEDVFANFASKEFLRQKLEAESRGEVLLYVDQRVMEEIAEFAQRGRLRQR